MKHMAPVLIQAMPSPRFLAWRYTLAAAGLLAFAALAPAVSPVVTVHDAQGDFVGSGQAEFENLAAFSGGEVMLANAVTDRPFEIDGVDAVTAVAPGADGVVYCGSAPGAVLFSVASGDAKAETLADLGGAMVTDLLVVGGRLYAATAGAEGGVFGVQLDGPDRGRVETLLANDQDASCWALAADGETLYVATGGEGLLYRLSGSCAPQVVFDADQAILRSLAIHDDALYVGTAGEGLVYLIDLSAKAGEDGHLPSRVVLDADADEIVALAVAGDGMLLAAASDVTTSQPRAPQAADAGRADAAVAADTDEKADQGDDEAAAQDESAESDDGADAETLRPDRGDGRTDAPSIPAESDPKDAAMTETPAPVEIPGIAPGGSGGNKVYMVDADGIIRVAGSVDRTIYDMVYTTFAGPMLLLACDGGGLHRIDPVSGIAADIANLDSEKPFALAAAADGRILVGCAAPKALKVVSAATARSGSLISAPIDAGQVSRWTAASVLASLPEGASASLSLSTGNTAEPDEKTWSDWSEPVAASGRWSPVSVPAGRFCRYRLSIRQDDGHEENPAIVDRISILHQAPNLHPEIAGVETTLSDNENRPSPKPVGPLRYRLIKVEASDPNADQLSFDYYFRRIGSDVWVLWLDDSPQPEAAWDASGVADGDYEIRVVASDRPDNPPGAVRIASRLSRVLTVDNTPPVIRSLAVSGGPGGPRLVGEVTDANRIAKVSYRLDSNESETFVPAADGVFDLSAERVDVYMGDLADLPAGAHVVSVTVTDEFGNAARMALEVVR